MPTAFLKKPFKTVCVDTVLFFAMFALVGHLTINYWEKYTIQNELYFMKQSLHTLKDTIGNIGKAYDSLHDELKELLDEVEKKQIQMDTPECWHKERIEARCKAKHKLDDNHHDFEVQTLLTTNKMKIGVGVETESNKNPHRRREHKATGPPGINVSTNTRNPLKSTGTSSDMSHEEHYRCQYDFDNSRHICRGSGLNDRNY